MQGDLGRIYSAIPWDAMVYTFGLNDSKKEPVSIFGLQGKPALTFLEHYATCSDKCLVEQHNALQGQKQGWPVAIYATNKNGSFTTKCNIGTDFKRKARAKREKQRRQMAAMTTKEKATRLAGSFGKEKEQYHLKKIGARTKETETLWIFFGIHTANALKVGRRMARTLQKAV